MFDVIGHDLIEAYSGIYEDEMTEDMMEEFEGRTPSAQEAEEWTRSDAIRRIINHTPKERLERYLEWNGIIGYSNRVYDISIGKF